MSNLKVDNAMRFEIWDVATGNCIGQFASEEEALARVSSLVSHFGTAYADDLELASENDLGDFQGTRSGAELLARADAVLQPR